MNSVYLKTTIIILVVLLKANVSLAQMEYWGVNLAGAEFDPSNLPGIYDTHYEYPNPDEVDYFTEKGMNVFRLPFRWERLQQALFEPFNSTELERMEDFVAYATFKEAHVVLDPHNYARYYDDIIGSPDLPVAAFEDFWSRLATHFKENPNVIFALVNEPHSMSSELWLDDANAAIRAIRRAGAANLILVPGNAWSGAHSWTQSWYGTANSVTMLQITDSLDNYAYDVHQYFDSDYSGATSSCQSETIGSEKLISFTNWARTNGKRGFLGEFGVADNDSCLSAADDMLSFMLENDDVWLGWTWWAAGPRWGNYRFSIEPNNGDAPQMAVLEQYIGLPITALNSAITKPIVNFILQQNFPNPFNPKTKITYELKEKSPVTLKIYDIEGREIKTLLKKNQTAGKHSAVL